MYLHLCKCFHLANISKASTLSKYNSKTIISCQFVIKHFKCKMNNQMFFVLEEPDLCFNPPTVTDRAKNRREGCTQAHGQPSLVKLIRLSALETDKTVTVEAVYQ